MRNIRSPGLFRSGCRYCNGSKLLVEIQWTQIYKTETIDFHQGAMRLCRVHVPVHVLIILKIVF